MEEIKNEAKNEAFEEMIQFADLKFRNLIEQMLKEKAVEGSIVIKLDIEIDKRIYDNNDISEEESYTDVPIPKVTHTIGSIIRIRTEVDTKKEGATDE